MRWSTIGWAVLATALLSAPAMAATIKVPSDYETIQAAVDAAKDGDTIVVSKGTYFENITTTRNGLRFLGKKAVWDGNISGVDGTCLNVTGTDILIQGFRFRHGRDQVYITGSGATVTKCTFTNADDTPVTIYGTDARIEKCIFRGMDEEAIYIDGDGAYIAKNRVSNGGDGGLDLNGDDIVVEKNSINVVEDDDAIYVSGDRARVEKNTCRNADGDGVEISGDDGIAIGNKVAYLDGYGVYVSGDEALVEGNTVLGTGDDGIYVSGDDYRILFNKVAHCFDDTSGIDASGNGTGDPALIEGNKIIDVVDDAFDISGKNVHILNNSVARSGGEDHAAFYVSGSGNFLSGNKAIDIDSDGFEISGSDNRLEKCVALRCTDDGFSIRTGNTDNEIVGCTAALCDGEGLENLGSNTVVTNSKFKNNRLDVTNAGSFGTFQGNSYKTGGVDTLPEVDVSLP